MSKVISLRARFYEAKGFSVQTPDGEWQASGTLCGNIDFVVPIRGGTFCLSPDEAQAIVLMLTQARHDVLEHSDPYGDPRIFPDQEVEK